MTWVEACHDKSLENLPYKIELNRQGKIIMSPTRNKHGFYQGEIAYLLRSLLPNGHVLVECAIDTPEGTYVADVAWATKKRFKFIKDNFSSPNEPEIAYEIWSYSNQPDGFHRKNGLFSEREGLKFWSGNR